MLTTKAKSADQDFLILGGGYLKLCLPRSVGLLFCVVPKTVSAPQRRLAILCGQPPGLKSPDFQFGFPP